MSRTFVDKPAERTRLPMLVGLIGPSGSGKTYSALRLATGMQRVTGGEIFYIDTESRRALHYADHFTFRHVEMDAPFSPLDYLEAIRFCEKKNAGVLIIDSMSHEHEGPGGVLDMHEQFLQDKCGSDYKKRERMTWTAWIKPKSQRRQLINEVLRMGVNAIFCFRAKPKIKIVKGEQPIDLGWQPIAPDEYVYEMTINCLLYPNARGVPNWQPDTKGEGFTIKRPENLVSVFADGEPLSEETGEGLAKWAEGRSAKAMSFSSELEKALLEMSDASDKDALTIAMNDLAGLEWDDEERGILKAAASAKMAEFR